MIRLFKGRLDIPKGTKVSHSIERIYLGSFVFLDISDLSLLIDDPAVLRAIAEHAAAAANELEAALVPHPADRIDEIREAV